MSLPWSVSSVSLFCGLGGLEGKPWLLGVDASAPVGHVSAGSTSSGRTKMKVVPFFSCDSTPLERFRGDALLAGDGNLPAPKLPPCFEKDIVYLNTRLFLGRCQILDCLGV